ncbi:major histocompatibility complex class I-related gene protein-like [Crotalus tigris]|uniref:major histocompatibility complex class I-related gene protein-like n=1 Tax=Crotalus tigris TaxID=88082 RepID=UPI00192F799F|nr:major histocompatibility complex class I-related gene protein-like [Crotalus tigris]
MPPCPACLLVLGAALGVSVPGDCCGSPSHFLRYSYLHLSEPSRFLVWGKLDDQPIIHFDSLTGRVETLVCWMEEVKEGTFLPVEWVFRSDLENLSNLNNLNEELHTWQAIVGCELRKDGKNDGFFRYGYDGMDFLSFKKETPRWVADQRQAEKVKEKWEDHPERSQENKFYLEKSCIKLLRRYLSYKKEALEKTENPGNCVAAVSAKPPKGKVTHKLINDSQEILVCEAYGFYPTEIQVNWTRDGENWEQGIIRRNVTPNSDGTYYVWIGIKINPEERNRSHCHLKHEGLEEPLVLAFKEETALSINQDLWISVGIAVTILGIGILLFIYMRRRHLLDMWRRCKRIRYQEVRSSLGDIPLENVSVSSPSGKEDDIQPESLPQSEVTLEDTALSDLEVSVSTLRRREGKQQKLQRSQSWDLEARDKARETSPRMAGHSWPQPNRSAWTHSERNTEFNHL